VVFVLALCAIVLASCRRDASTPPATSAAPTPSLECFQDKLAPGALAGWNVLFVTFDTTRADHIGCYGYALAETPTIDGLAARGVKFDHAIADVPSTLPSHSTMMTGLHAPNHGARTNGFFPLDEKHTTLAEILKEHGYATAAFTSTYVLHGKFGLRQGFDTYNHIGTGTKYTKGPRRANHVTDLAKAWLTDHLGSNPDRPWMMWPHYFDPHESYDPPGEYAVRFADRLYDGEIAFADAHFGRLLEFLEQNGQLDRTLIVLAADHGEGLGDHLEDTHSRLIYDATMHVPFILSCPQLHDASCRVDDIVVGTVDIMPTVLSLLGIDTELHFDGRDLLTSTVDPGRALYIETLSPLVYHGWASLHGLRTLSAKFIQAPHPEYYNLEADPAELNNLFETDPAVADSLRNLLAERMANWPPAQKVARSAVPLHKHEADRLAALGYVSTTVTDGSQNGSLADPKDMVPLYEILNRQPADKINTLAWETVLNRDADSGARRRAVILARTADNKAPNNATYLTTLGAALYRAGRYAEAAEKLVEAETAFAQDERDAEPTTIAFKVMALYRLDTTDRARTELARLKESSAQRAKAADETTPAILQEAEAMLTDVPTPAYRDRRLEP
jgi:arylsulfatase A-like enzyme